ncbi:hypothetical protein [Phenylobacterium sp.]|uniref:hypothetical protein n=1 Tax=Phenylobacterium sp. TaxID=1871053 RepID=UPI0025FE43A2|nr:hypothetical protein [Phenylobacterium sp.]
MPAYSDLFMRANLNDQGQMPAPGNLSSSPDIIPYGQVPVGNPASQFSDFTQDFGQSVQWGVGNNIYVRGTNLAAGAESGDVYLYWSQASLLNWPQVWSTNTILPQSGNPSVKLAATAANQQVVAQEPFFFTPQMVLPSGDHVCLIGRVATTANPNPIPSTVTMDSFAGFIANNRGFSWRNIEIINMPTKPAGSTPDWTMSVDYEQGTQTEIVNVVLSCVNIPVGCSIGFTCSTPGPTPMLSLVNTQVSNPTSFVAGITSTIPAGFKSNIQYWFYSNGKAIPGGASVTLKAIYVPGSGAASARYARPLEHFGIVDPVGIGPTQGILLGSHSTINAS